MINKNDIITAEITGWGSDGAGVAHADGLAVFVSDGVPGDSGKLRILKVASSHAFAKIEKLDTVSPLRCESDCTLAGKCGGCALRHVDYSAELEFKRSRVEEALRRIGGVTFDVPTPLASPAPNGYRNKAVYQLAESNGRTVFGFYRRRTHDVLATRRCLLQSEEADAAAQAVCDLADALHIPVYNEKTRKGSLRRIMYRENAAGDAQLVIVSANSRIASQKREVCDFLLRRCPWLRSIFLCVNPDPTNTVLAGKLILLEGDETISETLCGLEFEVSPLAFFQVNRAQTERLYDTAAEFADAAGMKVLDLYCGTGTLTLRLARDAESVIGAEIVPAAVENAKKNAARNGIADAKFICGDAADAVTKFGPGHFDIISVDPPRKGLSPEAVRGILALEPKKIVYVSCDPATLARDIKLFREGGYTLQRVQPVDMFPRTEHIETVAQLCRNSAI